ncbi:hypothetical protein ACJX0J_005460, partial [Zea mays]
MYIHISRKSTRERYMCITCELDGNEMANMHGCNCEHQASCFLLIGILVDLVPIDIQWTQLFVRGAGICFSRLTWVFVRLRQITISPFALAYHIGTTLMNSVSIMFHTIFHDFI